MFPCRSRVATLRLGPKIFENAFFEKKNLAILFVGVSECFETGAIVGSFFLTRFQFLGPGSQKKKKNWSKKFRAHPVSLS